MADWNKLGELGNVEDRRSLGGSLAMGGGGLGVVGVLIVLAFNLLSGGDPSTVLQDTLNQFGGSPVTQQVAGPDQFSGADQYETFAAKVLGSNNAVWSEVFAKNGLRYQEPRLVLFRSATTSGCGAATSQVGPHYCPADATIYLDETFFDILQQRFKAKGGDVAEAYVIAHEVGHHVQNELGIMDDIQQQQSRADKTTANELSVQLELQADCFAGIWAHAVAKQGVFEPGEIEEAIDAAAAVGDDRIQKSTQGQVNPETWTHGSSEQRVSWFNRGLASGQPSDCATFET